MCTSGRSTRGAHIAWPWRCSCAVPEVEDRWGGAAQDVADGHLRPAADPLFYDYPIDEPAGPGTKGFSALARLYVASCNQNINALESDLPRLARVAGLERTAEIPAQDQSMFIAAPIGKVTAQEWGRD